MFLVGAKKMVEQTILSSAYILGVTKELLIKDLYNVFYNRIFHNITDPKGRTKWIFPAWPETFDIDNKDDYPVCILNSPEIEGWEKFTLTKKNAIFTISAEINSTSMAELDSLASQVMNAIETTRGNFKFFKITFVEPDGTDTDHAFRDAISVHNKIMRFRGKFLFNKTL